MSKTCTFCGTSFPFLSHLEKHMKIHTFEKPILCKHCQEEYSDTGALDRHMAKAHPQISRANKKEERQKLRDLKRTCSTCGKFCHSASRLVAHIRTHTGEKPYHCLELGCDKSYRQQGHLTDHVIRVHKKEKKHSCMECSKSFSDARSLQIHMRIHSGVKEFICQFCKTGFRQLVHLQDHVRTHTGEKNYQCSLCSKEFTSSAGLCLHMRCHRNEKPFSCSNCSKAFRQSSHLQYHLKSKICMVPAKKTDLKLEKWVDDIISIPGPPSSQFVPVVKKTGPKFNCLHCPRSYRTKLELEYHMRLHTDKNPHKAGKSADEFGKHSDLEKKQKKVTFENSLEEEQPQTDKTTLSTKATAFKCPYCFIPFKLGSGLIMHLKEAHNPIKY